MAWAGLLKRVAVVVGAAALGLSATPTMAGAQALPPLDFSQYDVLLNTIGIPYRSGDTGTSKKTKRHTPKPPARPTKRQRATLRFTETRAVTERVYETALAQADPGVDRATLFGQLDAARAAFRDVLTGRVGWRATDLGDVAAFSLVQGYATVTGDATLSPRGLAQIRRAVGDDLARQRSVRRMPDARQQEVAEVMTLRVVLLLSDINRATEAGDDATVAAARAQMRAWTEELFGVDVAKVRLTKRGLVRR